MSRHFLTRCLPYSALAVVAFPLAAWATPVGDPLPGPSGLGAIPTTQTVAPQQYELSLGYENFDLSDTNGHARTLPFVNLAAGFKNGEVGASYLRQKTSTNVFSSSDSYFTLHGKYRVYNSTDGRTAVAVGAHYYDFGSDAGFDLGNVLSVYATASYEFRGKTDRPIARLDGGILGQRARNAGDSATYARPFVGVEAIVSPSVSVAADYLAKHNDVARATTISLRYQKPDAPLSAQIGIGRTRSDNKFFVGVTYAFGSKR